MICINNINIKAKTKRIEIHYDFKTYRRIKLKRKLDQYTKRREKTKKKVNIKHTRKYNNMAELSANISEIIKIVHWTNQSIKKHSSV